MDRVVGMLGTSRLVTPVRRATLGSILAALGGQLVLVVSGIALARLLGPTDRGYVALLNLWPSILYLIAGIGLSWSVAYHIAGGLVDARRVVKLVAWPFAAQGALLILAHALILVAYLRGKPTDIAIGGVVTLAIGPALLAWDYALAVLQGIKAYASMNWLRYLPNALFASIAGGMLLAHYRNVLILMLLITIAYVFSATVTVVIAWRRLNSSQRCNATVGVRTLIAFGLRGYVGSLYLLDALRLDQLIVGVLLTPLSLGLYVVASSFSNLPKLIAQAIARIALPHIASTQDLRSRRSQVARFVLFGAAVCLATVLVLETSVGYLTPFFFGSSFGDAIPLARILLIGALCLGVRRLLAESLKGAGLPLAATIAEAASWVILVPALVILLPSGVAGIAWAVSLSFACSLVVLVVIAVTWDWRMRQTTLPAILHDTPE